MRIESNQLSIAFTAKSLCTRCGTCVGVCPEKALWVGEEGYPALDMVRCTDCGLCARTCPGGQLSYRRLARITFGVPEKRTDFDGHVASTVVGYARNQKLRNGGAGGGVVTALMAALLRSGRVNGCIATRMSPSEPWRAEPFIAGNEKELAASQGSKYMTIALNSIWRQVREFPGRLAYAGLPCHVHGFRLAAAELGWLREKIPWVIGLFCGGALEPYVVPELLQTKGIDRRDIADFQFRGGAWPGRIRAILKDGRPANLHYSNYKDGAYNYCIGLYMPPRCQTCLDGSNRFADVAISDAWTKDAKGAYKFKAHSRILVRTPQGARLISRAMKADVLTGQDVLSDQAYRTHRLQTKRKGLIAPLRVDRLLRENKIAPVYDTGVPKASAREKMTERVLSGLLSLGRRAWFRYPLIKLLTSKAAIPLIRLRLFLKQRKYRQL